MSQSIGNNVLKLLSSKVAVQIISLITAPILTRLFLPEHYGVTQIYNSISGVIIVIACLRYELSIPLGKNKREVMASFVLSVFIVVAFALIVLTIVPFIKDKIAIRFKTPELEKFLWILPLSILIGGFGQALKYYASQQGKFGSIAWADFISSGIDKFFLISLSLIIGASATLFFAGSILYLVLGILILLAFLFKKLISDIKSSELNFNSVWAIAKKHRKFPIFGIWSGLLNTISLQLPPVILGLYYSTANVGYYSLGHKMSGLPMVLLGGSISQVFFPAAAKEYNETGLLTNIVGNTFKRLIQIGIFPILLLGFLGKPLFVFVFGSQWTEAGVYAQILSMSVFFQFLSSPISNVFSILNRQGAGLLFNIGLLSIRMTAIFLVARISGPRLALSSYTIASLIGYLYYSYWILHNSFVSIRWSIIILFKYAVLSSLLLIPAVYFTWFGWNMIYISISVFLAILAYLYILYRYESGFHNIVIQFTNKLKKHSKVCSLIH